MVGASPHAPPTKPKPSYKLRVSSINCSSISRGPSSRRWSRKTTRNGAPKALAAGPSWSRCCSANSPTRFAARDLQRPGLLPGQTGPSRHHQSPQQIYPFLCQRTPARQVVRGSVLHRARQVPRRRRIGAAQEEVPFQEQAALARLDHHFAVPGVVSVGQVPPGQGRRQGSRAHRPPRGAGVKRSDPHPEGEAIIDAAPETALYVAALKQKGRKVVVLA